MTDCPFHSGIEAEIRAICGKQEIQHNELNRRLELLERMTLRVDLLEKGAGFTAGSSRWSDYIITVLISALMVLIFKLLHL
jgi:hypothetical protein